MAVYTRLVDGNQIWYNETPARWLWAVGPEVIVDDDHFLRYAAADWTVTETGDGTQALTDAAGGALLITTAALDDDSVEMQRLGASWLLASGKELYFGCKLQASKATQSDILVGLCIADTTLIDGMTDGVYFRKDDGDANIDCVTESGSSETLTDSGIDLVAATDVMLEFYYDGVAVAFLIDGMLVATHTATIPTAAALTISVALQNGEAGAQTLTVDWLRCIQINT